MGRVRCIDGSPVVIKMCSRGYSHVKLGDGVWELRDQAMHRLVLLAFVGPPPEHHIGCHKNDVPDDNRLDNLYWGTKGENALDKLRNRRNNPQLIAKRQIKTINARGFARYTYEYFWKEAP